MALFSCPAISVVLFSVLVLLPLDPSVIVGDFEPPVFNNLPPDTSILCNNAVPDVPVLSIAENCSDGLSVENVALGKPTNQKNGKERESLKMQGYNCKWLLFKKLQQSKE